MNYYLLIDILIVTTIVALSYYFYTHNLYEKLFEYFKLFLFITIAAKLASNMGYILTKFSIIKADSYSVLILIAFSLNLLLLLLGYKSLIALCNHFIDAKKIKTLLAKTVSFMEVIVLVTFSLYILMQIKVCKTHIHPILVKSYSYPYIQHFYKKFLDYDFVYMIISSDTNVNHKEVIFKSLKNSLQ